MTSMKHTLIAAVAVLGLGILFSLPTTADESPNKDKPVAEKDKPAAEKDKPRERPEARRRGDQRKRPDARRDGDNRKRPEGDRPDVRRGGDRNGNSGAPRGFDRLNPRDGQRPGGDRRPQGPDGRGGHPLISIFDRNRDGALSTEEINNIATMLKRLDRNNDGRITANELPGPPQSQQGGRPGFGRSGQRCGQYIG